MNVRYESSFEKDLKSIQDKSLLKRVISVIENVKQAGEIKQINNLRKLKGYESFYRIKLGDYRIGLEIIKDEVILQDFCIEKKFIVISRKICQKQAVSVALRAA